MIRIWRLPPVSGTPGLGWGDFRNSVIFGGRNPFSGRVDELSASELGNCCEFCWWFS